MSFSKVNFEVYVGDLPDAIRYLARHSMIEDALTLIGMAECGSQVRFAAHTAGFSQEWYSFCERFAQDCVAYVTRTGKGVLIGPKADAWGEFNPEFWVEP